MIKFVAGLVSGIALSGGALFAANLPSPPVGQCDIIPGGVYVEQEKPTYVNPDPAAESMRLDQVCSFNVPYVNGDGGISYRKETQTFHNVVDTEQAGYIVEGAAAMLATGDVYVNP